MTASGDDEVLPRRFTRADLIPAIITLVAMVMAGLIFGFFMVPYPQQVGFDEGYEAAAAERIISGQWLPYVDAVSHRGPFLYWTLAVAQVLTGRFQWTGTRVLGLGSCLVTIAFTFLTGWAARWPLAGAIGAVSYALIVACIYDPGGGVGVHGEPVGIAYLMVATFLVALALYRTPAGRRRTILLAAGGVLVAIAGLTKQTLAIACGPISIWVLARVAFPRSADDDGTPIPLKSGFKSALLPFWLGGIGLILLVLGRYAISGHLRTFFYWSSTFNAKVYMEPYKGRVLVLLLQWFVDQTWAVVGSAIALAVALGRPVSLIQRFTVRGVLAGIREGTFEMTVGLLAVGLLFMGAIPQRFWGHYWVPIYSFFGLTVGVVIERMVRHKGVVSRAAQLTVGLAVVGVLLVSGGNRFDLLIYQRAHGSWINPRPDPVCAEITRLGSPAREPIFIWGVVGDLYITCRRPSVSMFPYTTVIAGIIPPFWDDRRDSRVPPGARETLLKELTTGAPKVLLDHPMGANAGMMDIPVLADFVNERYCRVSNVTDLAGRNITFYARRDLPACAGK